MGGDSQPVVIIPTNLLTPSFSTRSATCDDDVSDLESQDHMPHADTLQDEDSSEEEDDFPDFPPNFDVQSKTIPPHFLCPLTKSIMLHPVIDAEGNTYEKRAILRWLDLEDTSPVTGNSLSASDLVENKRRMAAIEKYREECWSTYNANAQDGMLKRSQRREAHQKERERKRSVSAEKRKIKNTIRSGGKTEKHALLTDKSNKLLVQMQNELDLLQMQHAEENEAHKNWMEGVNGEEKKDDGVGSHVEYLLHKKNQVKNQPEKDRVRLKRRDNYLDDESGGKDSLVVRKQSSKSPYRESKSSNGAAEAHQSSFESSYPPPVSNRLSSKSPHCERKSSRRVMQNPDLNSSIKSLESAHTASFQSLDSSQSPQPPAVNPRLTERTESRRSLRAQSALTSSTKSKSHRSSKASPAPPPHPKVEEYPHRSHSTSNVFSTDTDMNYRDPSTMDRRGLNKTSISERIIAEVNGCSVGSLTRATSAKALENPTTASTSSESQHIELKRDHGW
jgi:hypothetical protein